MGGTLIVVSLFTSLYHVFVKTLHRIFITLMYQEVKNKNTKVFFFTLLLLCYEVILGYWVILGCSKLPSLFHIISSIKFTSSKQHTIWPLFENSLPRCE